MPENGGPAEQCGSGGPGFPSQLLRVRDGDGHHLDRHVHARPVVPVACAVRPGGSRVRRAQRRACAAVGAGTAPVSLADIAAPEQVFGFFTDRGRARRARGALRCRGPSQWSRPSCAAVAAVVWVGADLRGARQPAARSPPRLGTRRRQRHLAPLGGRHRSPSRFRRQPLSPYGRRSRDGSPRSRSGCGASA